MQVAHELLAAESLAALHALCLRHLPLLHSQPCPSVLELAALLLNVTRATVRAMPTPSLLTMCDAVLPLISDAALPLQVPSPNAFASCRPGPCASVSVRVYIVQRAVCCSVGGDDCSWYI